MFVVVCVSTLKDSLIILCRVFTRLAVLLFSVLFFPYGYLSKYQKFFIFDKKIFLTSKAFLFSFLISLFATGGSLITAYTYRSSSIIWSINFIFFGYFIF